jgi:protein-tyrosine-phosphatase
VIQRNDVASGGADRPAGIGARVRPFLGRVARGLRAGADRILHPLRRRAAGRRIANAIPLERLVVLCYGNICRSPYAAALLEQGFRDRGVGVRIIQGGFFGPDRPSTDMARAVSLARGVSLETHRSRLVTGEEARTASLVIVMEARQADTVVRQYGARRSRTIVLGDLDPGAIPQRTIVDPYGKGAEAFAETYERIDRCIAELIRLAGGEA